MKLVNALVSSMIAILFVGCASLTPQQKLDNAVNLANMAAYVGTAIHLEDNEHDIVYFRAAVAALDKLAADGTYTPAALAAALEDLPVDVLQDEGKGSIIIMGTVMLFDQATNQLINADTPDAVKKIAAAIRDGIAQAVVRASRN